MNASVEETVTIKYIPGVDVITITDPSQRMLITTGDSLVIGRVTLISLLNQLVKAEIINKKVIVGILEEANTL